MNAVCSLMDWWPVSRVYSCLWGSWQHVALLFICKYCCPCTYSSASKFYYLLSWIKKYFKSPKSKCPIPQKKHTRYHTPFINTVCPYKIWFQTYSQCIPQGYLSRNSTSISLISHISQTVYYPPLVLSVKFWWSSKNVHNYQLNSLSRVITSCYRVDIAATTQGLSDIARMSTPFEQWYNKELFSSPFILPKGRSSSSMH